MQKAPYGLIVAGQRLQPGGAISRNYKLVGKLDQAGDASGLSPRCPKFLRPLNSICQLGLVVGGMPLNQIRHRLARVYPERVE